MELRRHSTGELCALPAAAAVCRCAHSVGIRQTAAKAAAGVSAKHHGVSACSFPSPALCWAICGAPESLEGCRVPAVHMGVAPDTRGTKKKCPCLGCLETTNGGESGSEARDSMARN
uniref:Hypothetical secreted protein 859 n=1 Tax=Amblyomma variegatum TaxID=34610 RepID=F0JA90_AMBVA|nr:TPA_inf: hypothetical secreted protein 859 [Amblyomma variegatum]